MKPKFLGFLAAALLSCPLLHAAPIAYDESVSGDITGDGTIASITTRFDFQPGINTVAGRLGFSTEGNEPDYFRFVVPAGAEFHSFSISWSDPLLIGNPGSAGITSCRIYNDAFSAILATVGVPLSRCANVVTNPSGSLSLFGAQLPLASGTYGWAYGAGFSGSDSPLGFAVDYVLSFGIREIAPVPEPGTLVLLGLGLVGVGLSRHRKAA